MKVYKASRNERYELVVTVNGRLLNPRNDLANHNQTGFSCGYSGTGAAQLALALMADHLCNDESALALHQDFKWHIVAHLPREGWILTSKDIDEALQSKRRKVV